MEISSVFAQQLSPGNKKSFRVKGKLDDYKIKQVALMPMGKGSFILPLNSEMRKNTGKKYGDFIKVEIKVDTSVLIISSDLLECLEEDLIALENFNKLSPSLQRYYSNWINNAKTLDTKAKRIGMTINAFVCGFSFGEMMKDMKEKRLN